MIFQFFPNGSEKFDQMCPLYVIGIMAPNSNRYLCKLGRYLRVVYYWRAMELTTYNYTYSHTFLKSVKLQFLLMVRIEEKWSFKYIFKDQTTGRQVSGRPGRFWQRLGLVGSGKEKEVGRPRPTSNLDNKSQQTEPEYSVSF